MAFTSFGFLALVGALVLLTNALPSPRLRALLLLAANAAFIASYVDRVREILPFLAFLGLGFTVIEAVRRARSSAALWSGLSLIVISFVILKRYVFFGSAFALPFPYLIVGLSYVLFRVLQLVIDASQGGLEQGIAPLDFFNYTCNLLSFVAGPIQRYEDYKSQSLRPLVLDENAVFLAFARVIKGYFKVAVISAVFNNVFTTLSERLLAHGTAVPPHGTAFLIVFVSAAVAYTVYLYANFAGYMDIVIGVGRLIGQELPENFNHPFAARSFLDFWSRWHMTLSAWFKTYLFNPLIKALANRFPSSAAAPFLGVVAFFVTFLVMGVWHGSTSVFVVYGLLLGAGASINKLWQVLVAKRLGKQRYKALGERTLSIYLSRGLTLAYFALALTCLWVDLGQLRFLVSRLGPLGLAGAYLGLACASGVAFFAWDWAVARFVSAGATARGFNGVVARNLGLALQLLVIATVASFFHKAPEFVYRAF